MEICDGGEYVFVRLETGEEIVTSLKEVARLKNIRAAAITSGVGMVSAVRLGFFCVPKDDYDNIHEIDKILDLSSIQGNITWLGDEPVPHIHMTMNDPVYNTYSGHIIEAICHITMEIFIRKLTGMTLNRVKLSGQPATRITAKI
jgi:predicted DNA-binding protein with PD1-like motif